MGLAAASAFAFGCSQPSFQKVDIAAENMPPLAASVSGSSIQLPSGIGVAFVVTAYVDGKKTDDTVSIDLGGTNLPNANAVPGVNKNEFFLVGVSAGNGTLAFDDVDHSSGGVVSVPVTVTAQPGTASVTDGGIVFPDAGAATDAAGE